MLNHHDTQHMPPATASRRIVIVGAGIGGLAAAVALTRAGHDVHVFERNADVEGEGGALTIWPNALTALGRIGLAGAVASLGNELRSLVITSRQGRVLTRFDVEAAARDYGYPMIAIRRADLLRALVEAFGRNRIHLGAACAGLTQDSGAVRARFADGREVQADVLIGADGTGSAVRKHLCSRAALRYAGYRVYSGVTPAGAEVIDLHEFRETWGRGLRFAVMSLSNDEVFWGAYRNGPAREPDDPGARQGELARAFDGWGDETRRLIRESRGPIVRKDAVTLTPLSAWSHGRVTLLGDAAHAMTPNAGQGACQAIEDAVILARSLAEDADVERALRRYETLRRCRTRRVSAAAERYGRLVQNAHPLVCASRDAAARAVPSGLHAWQMAWSMRFPE